MNYLTNYYKNLSEQLQQRVNHLQRLVETANLTPDNFDGPDADRTGSSAEVVAGQQAMQLHNQISDLIARHHSDVAPHVDRNLGSHSYDKKKSKEDMFKKLTTDKYFTKNPFTSVKDAIEKIGPEFMPPVIYPEKDNPHWGNEDVIDLGTPSGEIHPHAQELVWDRVLGSIKREEESKKKK